MSLTVKHGAIAHIERLTVERDLSGGVKVVLGGKGCVLSPPEAVRFAMATLQAAGVAVELKDRAQVMAS